MVLALPYLVRSYLALGLAALGLPSPRRPQPSARRITGLPVAVLGFWVLRKVPAAPFVALAP